jgi:hypothetical protein
MSVRRAPLGSTLEVMKTGAAVLVSFWFMANSALAADPYCGESPSCVGHTEYDSRLTEFYVRVLEAMHIQYKVERQNGNVTIWWVPKTETEQREVDDRASQYSFAIHACPRDMWPTPETPAATLTYCPDPSR